MKDKLAIHGRSAGGLLMGKMNKILFTYNYYKVLLLI